jgi:hypothetical protein
MTNRSTTVFPTTLFRILGYIMRSVPFVRFPVAVMTVIGLSAIGVLFSTPEAQARQRRASYSFDTFSPRPTPQMTVPKDVAARAMRPIPGAEPTCYVKMPGRSVQFLDHLCGVNDPKPDRKRNPNELDKDGMPFVLKENYQAVRTLQQQLAAAQQRMETELPFSENAKQLMAEQKALFSQYGSTATSGAEMKALQQRIEANQKALNADSSFKKAYEMMGRLYQQK